MVNEIYQALPGKKKHWVYGDKDKTKLSPEVREKIDRLTESLMSDSKAYKEYLALIKEEQRMKTRMFGQTTREEKNQLTNELFTMKKRLGNSLLTELRKQDSEVNQRREKLYGTFGQTKAKESFQQKNARGYSENPYTKKNDTPQKQRQPYGVKQKGGFRKEPFSKGNQFYKAQMLGRNQEYFNQNREHYKHPILSQKNLFRIKRSLDTHTDKYKELREYEQMKQRIRWEQERR